MARRKPPARRKGKPPPKCKAILLCDQAILEAETGRISLIGIFDGLSLPRFPDYTRPFTAYVQLVEGIGRYEVDVEIHDLRENRVLARAPTSDIEFTERLSKINLIIAVPALLLQHDGSYDLVVFANNQEIDRQKFSVARQPEEEHGPEAPEEPEDY